MTAAPSPDPSASTSTTVGPTALAARALAPDLARGFLLLFIALANAHVYLYARDHTVRGYPAEGSLADQVVALVQMTLVDGRSYPMFAFLFGYGMVQLLQRQEARGSEWESVRPLLRRRGAWMVVFGAVHGVLLWSGDIIGAYGLTALIWVGMLRAHDRTLLRVAGVFLAIMAILGVGQGMSEKGGGFDATLPSVAEDNPLLAVAFRGPEWIGLSLYTVVMIVPAALLGIWAARRRVLDDPERNRTLLVRTASVGLGLAVVGGLPMALMSALFWTDPSLGVSMLAGALHTVTGYAGGLGWAALIGLVAIWVGDARGPLTSAVEAVGQRSLSCYLMQSVVFVAVFAPYAGGLGARVGVAGTAAIALGTWLLTVIVADIMRRASYRGPAEIALRRLTYRRTS